MDPLYAPPGYRSGFVALAGKPNVGKSTLINQLLKQPIAAVSPRPQMTRKTQLGILTLPMAQLIFVDTPGLHRAQHKLGQQLNLEAQDGLGNADVILIIFDMESPPDAEDEQVVEHIRKLQETKPLLIALNKIDKVPGDRLAARSGAFRSLLLDTPAIGISALNGDGVEELIQMLIELVPEGPLLYPEDTITLTYERDIAADLIRAAALEYLRDEVPHAIAIRIDTFKEREEHGAYIEATLFVERDSQKGIVIGKGGAMLKQIGTHARKSIEQVLDRKVYLELRVKVLSNWRNDPNALQQFGFQAAPDEGGTSSKGNR
ncbi:MAG: GTPase Era [Anaerolineales bacterium]|nr:GTPase Era [Anaerolineales bacterium]